MLFSISFLSRLNPEKELDSSDLPDEEKQLLENCFLDFMISKKEKF
jgi:hypothetical protein